MKLIILQTNISCETSIKNIQDMLNNHAQIYAWSVDTEDIDNVLRIEAHLNLTNIEIIESIQKRGYQCDELKC